jgi:hypothetical protein
MGYMDDRRKTHRTVISEPVIIVWDRGNAVGEVRDVSPDGMYVALANIGNVTGTSLVVQVLPAHPREGVELPGVVRWSDARGMGIELAPGDRGLAVIEGLIGIRRPD